MDKCIATLHNSVSQTLKLLPSMLSEEHTKHHLTYKNHLGLYKHKPHLSDVSFWSCSYLFINKTAVREVRTV